MAARVRHCVESSAGCYIHVSGVAEAKIDAIDDAFQDLGIRSCVRFTYEHNLKAMIIRCMPSEAHERASWSFMIKLAFKIAAIPGHSEDSILPVGSTRFSVPGKRSKEADGGIKPADTRADGDEWPSLIIEVGMSQTLLALHQDACWWLDHSNKRTRMVIMICIEMDPKSIRLERWERLSVKVDNSRGSPVKTTSGFIQYFDIDHCGNVSHYPTHPDLVIPYKSLFDTGYDVGTDITISKAELSTWALKVFRGLH
ncbi:hypothetical protein HOY80DRAFT_896630 [Tuber brumale]|nr:hypothetical protein HOY80DRAFT_896630 [Tuber brumale]